MSLKYPGSKKRSVDHLIKLLGNGHRLVDPFCGSAALFFKSDYKEYLLCDINADVINLYQYVKDDPDGLITGLLELFKNTPFCNETYYRVRDTFNACTDIKRRSHYFVWLNQTSYNGMIRYSKKTGFNIPAGRMKNPRPDIEGIQRFHQKCCSCDVTFLCQDFTRTFQQIRPFDHVMVDPPYSPLPGQKTNFTCYVTGEFGPHQHDQLAALCRGMSYVGARVIVCDHDTPEVRARYKGSEFHSISVARSVSADKSLRKPAPELRIRVA